MSIAAANLWTRNVYKEYFRREATPAQEAKQAKLASLVVKFGAVAAPLGAGRRLDGRHGVGMTLLYNIPNPATNRAHFGGSALALDKVNFLGWQPFAGSQMQIYVGFVVPVANLLVAVLGTLVARWLKAARKCQSR